MPRLRRDWTIDPRKRHYGAPMSMTWTVGTEKPTIRSVNQPRKDKRRRWRLPFRINLRRIHHV